MPSIYLHVPAYRLGEKRFPEREVLMSLPMDPFPGMQISVAVGDGSSDAPSRTAIVQIASILINPSWHILASGGPLPTEDLPYIECTTSWVRRPGRR